VVVVVMIERKKERRRRRGRRRKKGDSRKFDEVDEIRNSILGHISFSSPSRRKRNAKNDKETNILRNI